MEIRLLVYFFRSEAVIPDRFKNLILLIDGLSFGTFGFHPLLKVLRMN